MWDPYPQQWDDPGPWWLRIYLDDPIWKGAFGDDVEAALKQLPRSVALIEPGTLLVRDAEEVRRVAVRSGFEVPPISDSVPDRYIFVPLYEPAVEVESGFVAGWYAFFVLQGQREFPPTLRRVRVDAEWLPGFAMENGKVRAIRPRCLRHEG